MSNAQVAKRPLSAGLYGRASKRVSAATKRKTVDAEWDAFVAQQDANAQRKREEKGDDDDDGAKQRMGGSTTITKGDNLGGSTSASARGLSYTKKDSSSHLTRAQSSRTTTTQSQSTAFTPSRTTGLAEWDAYVAQQDALRKSEENNTEENLWQHLRSRVTKGDDLVGGGNGIRMKKDGLGKRESTRTTPRARASTSWSGGQRESRGSINRCMKHAHVETPPGLRVTNARSSLVSAGGTSRQSSIACFNRISEAAESAVRTLEERGDGTLANAVQQISDGLITNLEDAWDSINTVEYTADKRLGDIPR